jgi:predicted Rossmann fold nucleotide-binding protein DprA/Smf involved in DNA uptake
MQHSEALAAKIEAHITELKTEIAAHERALAALRGRKTTNASSTPASNGRRARAQRDGRATRQPRRPRRPRTASAEAVFDALKEGQDQASAIARQFGVSAAVVRNRLAQLEEAGRVSRTGNRRSTRWRSHAS